jgi:DNA invertase Pin-like site-specific DNA recombinase
MSKAIILSRVSTNGQDLTQQTDEVLKEVYSDGYKNSDIIIIEDKESAIKLSEEERKGLNKMKDAIKSDCSIKCVYIYELSRLSRRQLVLYSIRDFLVERKIIKSYGYQ